MFWIEVSSAHQGYIYLIKNTVKKTFILQNIITIWNNCLLVWFMVKFDQSRIFSI